MRDKSTGIAIVFGVIGAILMYAVTGGFAPGTQELVASSDVTVRSTSPTVNDDLDFNFQAGYIWIDAVGGAVYICEDASDGAAVWTDITAGGSTFNAEEGDSLVISNVSVIDFGPGFDLTESPSGELNVVLDYTEDAVDLSGAEVTGTLDISDHTNLIASTGITLTGDTLTVDLGTAIDTSEITDGTILEADLAAVDSPADEECLTYETTTGDFEWQACASGGTGTLTTIEDGDVQVGDADIVTLDFGTGISCSETPDTEVNCSADLGTAIDTSEITDGTILEADIAAVDTASDEECLTFEATGGDFEWQTCSPGGGGTLTTIKEADSGIGDPDIVALDFGAGFDCTESPDTEINCVLDYTEDPVNLASSEITGTLAVGNGGTGQTAATADAVLVANGSAYVARVIADCDAAGNALNYDTTTDAWSCATGYLTTVDISDDTNLAAGTGITLTGDTLSVDLGTAIDTSEITDGTIAEADLAAVDTASDEECLTFEATGGDFEWQPCDAVTTYSLSKTLLEPVDADSYLIEKLQSAITITDIHCIVDPADSAESVVIDIQETNSTGDSGVSFDATITCDNDGAEDDGSLTNAGFDAGDYILWDIGTVTGTVDAVTVTIYYTVD